ncbi:hypothetical protein OEA41_001514 [Lepraria neglecta]|uniref:Ribose-5-phosphate isomerase n=1 Tax=Lepraria neglecta TaxID=209136 RepID=A0AAE0DLZ4_9LECA|nr:hypothetical protein OEA41_001514 [Lepraria neglecta]
MAPSTTALSDIENAKRNAARAAVAEHFDPAARYVGIGSGSTIVILKAHLKDLKFDSPPPTTLIDVAFDGADEIDDSLNCIKGGGACLYQEKLVATQAKKFICVADHRKLQTRLLKFWKYIPIEVEPLATHTVMKEILALGATSAVLREGHMMKAGPIKTDQDNFIIDACFQPLLLPADVQKSGSLHPIQKGMEGKGEGGVWEVSELAREIKAIEGVLSVGLFVGENGEQAVKRGGGEGVANEDGTASVRS